MTLCGQISCGPTLNPCYVLVEPKLPKGKDLAFVWH